MKQAKFKERILWQWKWMEYLACAIVFLTPLYFNMSHWFPFNSSKTLLASFGVLVMAIFFAWGLIRAKNFSIKITPLHLVLGIFISILTLSSILGVDPRNSFFGIFSFPTNLIYIYIVTLFALFIGFLIRNNKNFLPKILTVSFLSSVIVASFSYTGTSINKIFTDHSGTIGNSSYAGAYLLFNVCFGIALFFYYKKLWKKILLALGVVFIFLCPLFFSLDVLLGKVGLSQIIADPVLLIGVANGAAIGLLASLIAIICFYFIFSSKKIIKIIGFILLFIFLSGIFYVGHVFMDPNSKIHSAYVESKGENRFLAWDIARKSVIDRPLLGSGFNNYSYNFQKYLSPKIYDTGAEFFFQPHNIIWEYASNTGILGLTSFISLLFFTLLSLFKSRDEEGSQYKMLRISLIGILFGYFIQNLFVFDTPTTYLMLFLVIGVALGLSSKTWNFELIDKSKMIRNIIAVVIILASLASIILFVILPWRESIKWRRASSTNNLQELTSLRQGLQEISLFGGVGDSAYQATKLFNFYTSNISKVDDSNRKYFVEEIDSLVSQVERDQLSQPPNYRATLIIGKLLSLRMFIVGKLDEDTWDKANSYLNKTLYINDQSPEVHLAKAQLYIFKRNYVQARASVITALTLVPTYKASYSIGKRIQNLSPNKDFDKYITEMEDKWVNHTN